LILYHGRYISDTVLNELVRRVLDEGPEHSIYDSDTLKSKTIKSLQPVSPLGSSGGKLPKKIKFITQTTLKKH